MKLKTKKQISLGVLSAVAVISVPIATVVSCGDNAPKQSVSVKKNEKTSTENTKKLKETIKELEKKLLTMTNEKTAIKIAFKKAEDKLIQDAKDKQSQIDKKQSQIDDLNKQIKKLNADNASMRKNISTNTKGAVKSELDRLKKEKTQLSSEITQLKNEKIQLEKKLKQALDDKKLIEDKLNKSTSVFAAAKTSVMSVLSDIKNAAVKYFESKKTIADKQVLAKDVEAAKVKTKATMQTLLSGPNSIIDSLLFAVNDPKISKYAKLLQPFMPLITSMLTTLVDDLFTNIQNAVYYNPTWMSKEVVKAEKVKVLENFNVAFEDIHKHIQADWYANEMAIKIWKDIKIIKKTKTVTAEQAKYYKKLSDSWKLHLKTHNFIYDWKNNNKLAIYISTLQNLIKEKENNNYWTLTTLTGSQETDKKQMTNLFEGLSKEIKPADFDKNPLLKHQKNKDNSQTLEMIIDFLSTVKPGVEIQNNKLIYDIVSKMPDSKKHVYKDSKGNTKITIDYSVRSLINVFNKMITYKPWTEGALIDNKAISGLVLKVFGKSKSSIKQIAAGGGMGSILSLIPKLLEDLRNGASTFENNLQPLFSILFGDKGKLVFDLKLGDDGKSFYDYKWYSPQLQVFNSKYIIENKKHYITDADQNQFFGALLKLVQKMMMPKP